MNVTSSLVRKDKKKKNRRACAKPSGEKSSRCATLNRQATTLTRIARYSSSRYISRRFPCREFVFLSLSLSFSAELGKKRRHSISYLTLVSAILDARVRDKYFTLFFLAERKKNLMKQMSIIVKEVVWFFNHTESL